MRLIYKTILATSLSVLCAASILSAEEQINNHVKLSEITVKTIDEEEVKLSKYQNKVLLIVNTASKCGFTPQYRDLQKLYDKYHQLGFEILAFPSNDFGNQEPSGNEDIKKFCKDKYGVTFPLFARGDVSGEGKQPLYRFLTELSEEEYRGEIEWNFEKFVIDRNGKVVGRFGSFINPLNSKITDLVEKSLK